MTPELDAAAIAATLIILAILASSAVLWIRHIQRPQTEIIPDANVPVWNIGWVNFLLFICAEIVVVSLVQIIGAHFLKESINENAGELTPWIAVAAVLLLQIPLIAVFFFLRHFVPHEFGGRLNSQSYSLGAALKEAAPLFLMFLPVIWIVTFVWTKFLEIFQSLGVIEEIEPQELITLFQGGGDPIAIGLLIIFAVILAPLVEELIFRGCIYRFLKSKMAFIAAQVLSGTVFAMMHGNLLSFVPLIMVGVVLARVYEKSGSILVPMCFHAFFNAFSLLMLFIVSQSNMLPQ